MTEQIKDIDSNPELENQEPQQKNLPSRRNFLHASGYTIAAAAALTLLGGGCNKKADTPDKPAAVKPESDRLVERGNLPESKITNEAVPLIKPNGIEMSDEAFEKACTELANKIFKLMPDLKAELDKSGADHYDLIKRFVVAAYDLAYQTPGLKAYLDKNQPKDINEFVERSNALQPLLLAGGYYFCAEKTGKLDQDTGVINQVTHITMAKVIDKKMNSYKDDKGTKKVPLYILGKPSYTNSEDKALARYIAKTDATVVFKERVRLSFYKKLREMHKQGYEVKNTDIKKLLEEYMNETLIHEGTHPYLKDRYPKSGETAMENMYHWPLMMRLENGKKAGISQVHHPVQLQELCAVGNEIYHSNAAYPLTLILALTLTVGNNPVHGYKLVSKALPLIVMKHAKGPEKQRLLEALSQNRGVQTFDFVDLALKMSDKQKQMVGKELYELGLHMIKILQDGQMRQVKIPKTVRR